MEKHEFGFKQKSLEDKKYYIYPNCKESLLAAIKDGYKLEYDTMEVAEYGHHRIWIPYDGEVNEHYTCYRMIPKEDEQ